MSRPVRARMLRPERTAAADAACAPPQVETTTQGLLGAPKSFPVKKPGSTSGKARGDLVCRFAEALPLHAAPRLRTKTGRGRGREPRTRRHRAAWVPAIALSPASGG